MATHLVEITGLTIPEKIAICGINSNGEVIGSSGVEFGIQKAFLYDDAINELGTLGGLWSQAESINNDELIVGSSHTSDWKVHAFLYENDIMTDLGALGGSDCNSYGADINNIGQVVGRSYIEPNQWQPPHAFIWESGTMTDLGTLDGDDCSVANAINNNGVIVGVSSHQNGDFSVKQGFFYSDDEMFGAAPLYADCSTALIDINDNEAAVGYSEDEDGNLHAVFWGDNGAPLDLGSLGGFKNIARAINNSNVIVGSSETDERGPNHAFIWKDSVMIDLNDLIPSSSGWELLDAFDINEDGQIVGYGTHNGQVRAFLLTPI